MPKRRNREKLEEALRKVPADRAGLPARDSIADVKSFVAPDNQEYQILRTTEQDAYDKPEPERRRSVKKKR